jgi:hypothetical protein
VKLWVDLDRWLILRGKLGLCKAQTSALEASPARLNPTHSLWSEWLAVYLIDPDADLQTETGATSPEPNNSAVPVVTKSDRNQKRSGGAMTKCHACGTDILGQDLIPE